MHPLLKNLSELTNTQIEEKINKLQQAYFSTTNFQVQDQIVDLLDSYKFELQNRQLIEQEKSQDGENPLDELINVT